MNFQRITKTIIVMVQFKFGDLHLLASATGNPKPTKIL